MGAFEEEIQRVRVTRSGRDVGKGRYGWSEGGRDAIEKEREIDTENNIKKENVWKLENDIEKDALLQGLIFQLSHFLYLNSF